MDTKQLEKLDELNYAELSEDQERRLRELERQFNQEYDTAFYFMVMKK